MSHADWDATLGYEGEDPSKHQLRLRKQIYKPLNDLSYMLKAVVTVGISV